MRRTHSSFHAVSSDLTAALYVTSAPVPAVVGTAIQGTPPPRTARAGTPSRNRPAKTRKSQENRQCLGAVERRPSPHGNEDVRGKGRAEAAADASDPIPGLPAGDAEIFAQTQPVRASLMR